MSLCRCVVEMVETIMAKTSVSSHFRKSVQATEQNNNNCSDWIQFERQDPHSLSPPFSKELDPLSSLSAGDTGVKIPSPAFPALVHTPKSHFLRPKDNILSYLTLEMDVSRLNRIHKHLWLAGLPKGARPLHRQKLIGREISVTEQADLHLVWSESRIFIKPLPMFLLTYETWVNYLCCEQNLYKSACGFLISYVWLVCHKSDLRIAQDLGLLPLEIDWEHWIAFIDEFLDHVDLCSADNVNKRYNYGELRLSRLNWIYRLDLKTFNVRAFNQGYFQGPNWYALFLKQNFGWLVVVFAYIAIVLSAMQVGLATSRLGQNDRFQDLSYGFSVFAITMPVIVVGIILIASVTVSLLNVLATLKYNRMVENKSHQLARFDDGGLP